MSASMRIIPQDEADKGFGLLKDIVEMVKNPKAIEEAYEARRKGAQLSDDEVAKAAAARALIAQANNLQEALKQKEAALEAAQLAHSGNVSSHAQKVSVEQKRLADLEEKLNGVTKQQQDKDVAHASERKELDKRAQAVIDNELSLTSKYDALATAETASKVVQQKESARLAAWEKKLKAQAAGIAAEKAALSADS